MKKVYNHQPRKVGIDVQRRINALGIGQKMQDLPEELWHESFRYYVKSDPTRKGGPNLRLIRLDPDKPSLTVTGYIFNKFVHPYENRFITPREAARLQGFPDDLEFKGTLTSVQRQIGDAVPIELGTAVFRSLLNALVTLWPDEKEYKALSLFSGAGGFDIAAKNASKDFEASIKPFACVEIEKDRCDTLREYFRKDVKIFQKDIVSINAQDILGECKIPRQEVRIVYGGPPCQSFSQAGKQKGICDPRGVLIFEFMRFVEEIHPPFFIMENVSNLRGISKGLLLQQVLDQMKSLGYRVDSRILTATHYGSAQKRRRLFFIGSREDLSITARLPEPTHGPINGLFKLLPIRTVSDAFSGLPKPDYKPVFVP